MKTLFSSLVTTRNLLLVSLVGLAFCPAIQAQTYTTAVVIPYNPSAPDSNFSAPAASSNTTTYTVQTGSDATNFYANVSAPVPSTDISGLQFANIYITSAGHTDGLIFSVGSNGSTSIFDLNSQTQLSMTATAASGAAGSVATNNISLSVPFSFLESNPFNNGFAVAPGDLVRISYSQSFGYTFVGGSGNYPVPTRLGGQLAPAAGVPEPSTWAAMLGGVSLLGFVRRFRRASVA